MEKLPIEGEAVKEFRIFRCNKAGEIVDHALAEFDNIEEARAYRRRLDYFYRLQVEGKILTIEETINLLGIPAAFPQRPN